MYIYIYTHAYTYTYGVEWDGMNGMGWDGSGRDGAERNGMGRPSPVFGTFQRPCHRKYYGVRTATTLYTDTDSLCLMYTDTLT